MTVNGTLWLDGAKSFVADAGKLTSDSALTGLTSVAGNFWLENGATVAPTGDVSVTGSGTLGVEQHRRPRGQRSHDRRNADQQQHQWQWRLGRQHWHNLG
jgi:hypothetical protein